MSPDYAFLLGVAITGIGFLGLGFHLDQSYRRSLALTADLLADERKAHRETASALFRAAVDLEHTETDLAKSQDDLHWQHLLTAIVESERDMFQTAMRGLLTHQAKAELTEPNEPAGVADVYEFPVASVVPIRPKGSAS